MGLPIHITFHINQIYFLCKLSQGQLVKVASCLVQRKKTHFHNIVSGVQLILSNNGYIWMEPTSGEDVETGGFVQNLEVGFK